MSDIASRLKNLTPEQQKLLKKRLEQKGTKTPTAPKPSTNATPSREPGEEGKTRKLDFSFYFFSDDGSGVTGNKYQLLLDSARYADTHGFNAVWTPERHFQTFGGLYPNPSVTGAALATITENVRIRCGSVVLPLHHPIRIAEEWGVVDNLSGGRVDISFATGWHRHDYVIRPQNYEDRRKIMFHDIEVVRRLWRGEEIVFKGVDGEERACLTLPRPIQPELPFWVTVASQHTFPTAGAIGANVLTMLSNIDDLANNIAAYRRARTENGHDPRKGVISLMLHTFLGDSEEEVKELTRKPMYNYLGNYVKQFANLPGAPSIDNPDDMLAFAFERYYNNTSLLGTPEKGRALLEKLADIGVNEIACLIDFGVDYGRVMKSLDTLTEIRQEFTP